MLQEDADSDLIGEDSESSESDAENPDGVAHAAAASAPLPLDTWTRRGFKAAKALEAPDADGKLLKAANQGPKFQAAAAVLPGVHDSWAAHVDRQLSEAELDSLRSSMTRPPLLDAPEHPDYKVCLYRIFN